MISRADYGYISRQVWPAGLNVTRALGYSLRMHLIGYAERMSTMPFPDLHSHCTLKPIKNGGLNNFSK